jgi:hypothetical protein
MGEVGDAEFSASAEISAWLLCLTFRYAIVLTSTF